MKYAPTPTELDDTHTAYIKAKQIGRVVPELEPSISRITSYAFWYARYIINDKCSDIIEKSISKDPQYSYWYARDVIEGRCSAIIENNMGEFVHSYILICAINEIMNTDPTVIGATRPSDMSNPSKFSREITWK